MTVESSPYKITLSEANEVINEAASFGPPAEADSNGELLEFLKTAFRSLNKQTLISITFYL